MPVPVKLLFDVHLRVESRRALAVRKVSGARQAPCDNRWQRESASRAQVMRTRRLHARAHVFVSCQPANGTDTVISTCSSMTPS